MREGRRREIRGGDWGRRGRDSEEINGGDCGRRGTDKQRGLWEK